MTSARELHQFLEVSSRFADWIKNKIAQYGYDENRDYVTLSRNLEGGGRSLEYLISVNMAKELCMLENNDRGRQARLYFIECERVAREGPLLPATYLDALRALVKTTEENEQAQARIGEMQAQLTEAAPKVELYDKFMDSSGSQAIGSFAKTLGTGEVTLFRFLREKKIIFVNNDGYNVPYQVHINAGRFEVKEKRLELPGRKPRMYPQTRITPRGMEYVGKKWREK